MEDNRYFFTPLDKELMFWLAKPETLLVMQCLVANDEYSLRVVDISLKKNILQSTVTKMMIYFKKNGFVRENRCGNSIYLAANRPKMIKLIKALDILTNTDDWDDWE